MTTAAKKETPPQPKAAMGPTGFVRVDHPVFYPQACVVCQSAKGPLIDTLRELGGSGGRLYVCAQCVKWLALELGLVDGARMDELLGADQALVGAREQIEDRDGQLAKMLTDAASQSRRIEALEELLQQARDADRERKHLLEQNFELSKQLLQAGS